MFRGDGGDWEGLRGAGDASWCSCCGGGDGHEMAVLATDSIL